MEITLHHPRPHGSIAAIPSKSHVHRLLICAAFADTDTRILCPHSGEDIDATVRCLNALGAGISRDAEGFTVHPMEKAPEKAVLDCGESGSTLRFLIPVAAAMGVKASFVCVGRLPHRPLSPLRECLEQHGVNLSPAGSNPVTVSGTLVGGDFSLDGGVSSQFTTGLLLALGLTGQSARLTLTGKVESRPYLDMTVAALRTFGVKVDVQDSVFTLSPSNPRSPGTIRAEGDWSNAAFWLTAGALADGITVTGLNPDSPQGDRAIVPLLRQFGAGCTVSGDSMTVTPGKLRGIPIDASDVPDLVPVLAVAASVSEGETVIRNCGRLRLKESDRMASVREFLTMLGGDVRIEQDSFIIIGRKALAGGRISASRDHRIAMAAAVASVVCDDPVTIDGCECTAKSYPGFFDDFARLCGKEKA